MRFTQLHSDAFDPRSASAWWGGSGTPSFGARSPLSAGISASSPWLGQSRFVFANGDGTGTTSTADNATTADDDASPDAQETATNEAATSERIQSLNRRLDAQVSTGALSADAADTAKDALTSNKKEVRQLAERLANKTVDEEAFETAYEYIQGNKPVQKNLTRQFIQSRLTPDTYYDALEAFESGDYHEKRLARLLATRSLNEEDFKVANEALQSDDNDLKWSAQLLAKGQKSVQEFRDEMARKNDTEFRGETQQDAVNEVRETTHDRIMEILLSVDTVMEQLPEEERTKPLKKVRQNLIRLNNKDQDNRRAMASKLKSLHQDGKLDEDEVHQIMEVHIESEEDLANFKTALQAAEIGPLNVNTLVKAKKREWDIERDFEKQVQITQELIRASVRRIEYETLKRRLIENASVQAGINLKAGTPLEYTYPDPATNNIRTRTIKEVRIEDAPIVDKIGGDAIGRVPKNLIIFLDNGERYTLGQFLKWVNAADVRRKISSQVELEQDLGLPQLGMRLKSGQTLDYTQSHKRDADGNLIPQRDRVQIESIDDEKVVLSRPVVTLNPDEDPHAKLQVTRMAREMSLGEFSKWARRKEMMPEIKTLDALKQTLRNHRHHLNETWQRPPNEWPAITLAPNEVLQFGDDENAQFKIEEADDNGVSFEDGTHMSLPQFMGWVRQNNVERSNPEDAANRETKAAERLGEELDEAARGGILKKFMDRFKRRSGEDGPGGPDGPNNGGSGKKDSPGPLKSFFEKLSPFMTNKSEKPYGPLQQMISQYDFVSVMDIWYLVKELWEFLKRKHHRKAKNRYGNIGSKLPSFLGTEFKRVQQAAENEEVNQYKEAFSDLGTWPVLQKLHRTNDVDEAKAAFMVLTDKGELRWDDMKMWGTLNRLTAKYTTDGARLYLTQTRELQAHPDNLNDPDRKLSGEDKTRFAMDALWGEGQWAEWFSKNINAYNSNKSAYEYKGKQLEGDPTGSGGLSAEMRRLLTDWKNGRYVNPQEYEELIDFGIKYGKMSMSGKLYYLMEGVTAKCPSGPMAGQTLLHLDRLGEIDGNYLNQFPMLDYFTNKSAKPYHPRYLSGEIDLDQTQKGYDVQDFEDIINSHFKEESENNAPGNQFNLFLWENMIMDPKFKTRLSKGIRSAENMDHDDAHLFIPPNSKQDIDGILILTNGKAKFTNEGYKNGYAGFNQYLVSLSNRWEELNVAKLSNPRVEEEQVKETVEGMTSALRSYFHFDSILSSRRERRNTNRARLDTDHYNKGCVVDGMTAAQHKTQLDNTFKEICNAYGMEDSKIKLLFDTQAKLSETQLQQQIDTEMQVFVDETLPAMIETDGGKKMIEIIQRRKWAALKGGGENRANANVLGGIESDNRILTDKEYQDRLKEGRIPRSGRLASFIQRFRGGNKE